jgi:hypothetical protein
VSGYLLPLADGSGFEIRGIDGQREGELLSIPDSGGSFEFRRLPGTRQGRSFGDRE